MKKSVSIVGGGTAGLFVAAFLDPNKFDVHIYEKKSRLGRKFLVAGDGGFNLSHSEALDKFKKRYTPRHFLARCLDNFSNLDFKEWLLGIGIPTYIGSSKRIFPEKGIKPIEVLKAIEAILLKQGVSFHFDNEFNGWDNQNNLIFKKNLVIDSHYNIFALGGASWKKTGSDGSWIDLFSDKGISLIPFQSQNCAFKIDWPKGFISSNEGKPLKNISCSIEGQSQKGEVVITKFGLEGNAIYALSSLIQDALKVEKIATIYLDFKPTLTHETIIQKIEKSKDNLSQTLKKIIKLNDSQVQLIKLTLNKDAFLDIPYLVKYIKRFPLNVSASAPIDEAISTSGGISLDALTENFELMNLKNNYCIGEMIDWNAPTGGYLIQACVSMGVYLARQLNSKI